jgi:hypothetical protein
MEFEAELSLLKHESEAAAEEAEASILEAWDGVSVPSPPLSDPNVQAVTPQLSLPHAQLDSLTKTIQCVDSLPADAASKLSVHSDDSFHYSTGTMNSGNVQNHNDNVSYLSSSTSWYWQF